MMVAFALWGTDIICSLITGKVMETSLGKLSEIAFCEMLRKLWWETVKNVCAFK